MKCKKSNSNENNKKIFEWLLIVLIVLFILFVSTSIAGVYVVFVINGINIVSLVYAIITIGLIAIVSTSIILSLIYKNIREKNLQRNKEDLMLILNKFTEKQNN